MDRYHVLDVATMARNFTHLTLLAALLLLAVPGGRAAAQSGTCPDWTNAIMPPPIGTYPGSAAVCAGSSTGAAVDVIYSPALPCGGGLRVSSTLQNTLNGDWEPILIVPPAGMTFDSGAARFGFAFSADQRFLFNRDVIIHIESYNNGGAVIGSTDISAANYPQTTTATFQ